MRSNPSNRATSQPTDRKYQFVCCMAKTLSAQGATSVTHHACCCSYPHTSPRTCVLQSARICQPLPLLLTCARGHVNFTAALPTGHQQHHTAPAPLLSPAAACVTHYACCCPCAHTRQHMNLPCSSGCSHLRTWPGQVHRRTAQPDTSSITAHQPHHCQYGCRHVLPRAAASSCTTPA